MLFVMEFDVIHQELKIQMNQTFVDLFDYWYIFVGFYLAVLVSSFFHFSLFFVLVLLEEIETRQSYLVLLFFE